MLPALQHTGFPTADSSRPPRSSLSTDRTGALRDLCRLHASSPAYVLVDWLTAMRETHPTYIRDFLLNSAHGSGYYQWPNMCVRKDSSKSSPTAKTYREGLHCLPFLWRLDLVGQESHSNLGPGRQAHYSQSVATVKWPEFLSQFSVSLSLSALWDSPFKLFVDLITEANDVFPVFLAVGRIGSFILEQNTKDN